METESLKQLFTVILDFIAPSAVSGVFNLLIVIIWIAAISNSRRHVLRYKNFETAMLNKVKKTFDQWYASQADSRKNNTNDHTINLISLQAEIKDKDFEKSIIGQRIKMITERKQHRAKVSFDFLQESTMSIELCRPGMTTSQTVMNLSLMFGLLGTFVGLAIMVRGMYANIPLGDNHALDATNLSRVLQDMQGVFSGIRTAFTTSIFGMVCSIHCFLKNNALRDRREKYMVELDLFTYNKLLPASFKAAEDETLLESVSNQVKDSFSMLNTVLQENTSILEEMNGISTAVSSIVADVKSIIYKEGSIDHTEIISSMGVVNNNLTQVISHLPIMASNIETAAKNISSTLATIRSQMPVHPVDSYVISRQEPANEETNVGIWKKIRSVFKS